MSEPRNPPLIIEPKFLDRFVMAQPDGSKAIDLLEVLKELERQTSSGLVSTYYSDGIRSYIASLGAGSHPELVLALGDRDPLQGFYYGMNGIWQTNTNTEPPLPKTIPHYSIEGFAFKALKKGFDEADASLPLNVPSSNLPYPFSSRVPSMGYRIRGRGSRSR